VHTVTSATAATYCYCYCYYYYFYKSSREPACERAPFERGRAIIIIIIIIICLQASLLRPVGISKQLRSANQRTPGLAASKTREFGLAP
jgi:hypothetical protein